MKKKILTTAITTILLSLTCGVANAESGTAWVTQLEDASEGLSGIDVESILNESDLSSIGLDLDLPKMEDKKTSVSKEVKSDVLETFTIEAADKSQIIEEDMMEEEILSTDPSELVFLRFVPEGTRYKINKTFKILPKKKFIVLHNGERVLQNPQTKLDPEKSFCYLELIPSGKARILKKGKNLTVTGVRIEETDYEINKSYGTYTLRANKVDFSVDNENIKSLSCYSAKMFNPKEDKEPLPLMIRDLKEQMGDVISISYPAYEEI